LHFFEKLFTVAGLQFTVFSIDFGQLSTVNFHRIFFKLVEKHSLLFCFALAAFG